MKYVIYFIQHDEWDGDSMDSYELTREFLIQIGVDPDKLAMKVREAENKTTTHCIAYRRFRKLMECSSCPSCPLAQIERNLETS
jgi:hypothetical protein